MRAHKLRVCICRNRLGHVRSNKLVALFHNLRLLFRMKKTSYEEPAVAWADVEKAESGISKYGVAHYSATSVTSIAKPSRTSPAELLLLSEVLDVDELDRPLMLE